MGKGEERLENLRLRARQLEQDQRERRRTVDEVAGELAACLDRLRRSERVVLEAESELAHLYLQKESTLADTAALLAQQDQQRIGRAALLAETARLRRQPASWKSGYTLTS